MPLDFMIDQPHKCITIYGRGDVLLSERCNIVQRLLDDDSLKAPMSILLDVRKVTNELQQQELLPVAALLRFLQAKFKGRLAIVSADPTHIANESAVAMAADQTSKRVKLFVSENSASTWLASARH